MQKKERTPLRQLGRTVACFLPLLVLIGTVNVTADPANLFRRDYEYTAAQLVASGQNVCQLKNMDDRAFQKSCAELLPYTPDTLVLGSSRCMQLTARDLQCETLFNAGVTNGDLRDCISMYLLYKELDKLPRRVILMTDYCLFNPAKLDSRAMTDGYEAFARQTGTQPLTTQTSREKWKQLFSPAYFQTSVHFWLTGGESWPVATGAYETQTDMRRADGSYSYNAGVRETRAVDITPEQAQKRLGMTVGAYEPNSPVLCRQFETFVKQMQADGVEVIFQLPPLHPEYYAQMQQSAEYQTQLALEDYFKQFAAENGIKTFGSYNAAALQLTAADFHDGLHCSLQATQSYLPAWLTAGE